jgi:phosphomannomutase
VAEFELSRLRLGNAPIARVAHGPELLLALPDDASTVVRVSHGGTPVPLRRGQAFLVPDGMSYQIAADGPGSVFRAVVPGGAPAGEFRGRRPACLAFGTSGLRGLVTDITDLEAYINTRGFLDFLVASGDAAPGSTIALAGDLRPSTDSPDRSILRAVACAIRDAGMEPLYFGRIPTPALMAHGLRQGWPSVMVTGSHIPFDRNGIKFNKSSGEVLKEDEGPILEAVERVRRREYARAREGSLFDDGGWLREGHRAPLPPLQDEARRGYLRRYLDAFPAGALAGLRVAFYEHSAVGREVVVEILRGLGAEVFPVGRSEQFVAIDTEAISAEQLALLQALADDLREKIGPFDAIVSTDGDSDRPMLLGIDEGGRVRFLGGDVLGTLVADALGADAIAVPISASDLIDLHFTPKNIPVTRTRIGSPWVIAAMATLDGARRVGWEANGGFLTGSTLALPAGPLAPLPTRDAVLPLVTALHAARRAGGSLVDLLATLPRRFSQSGLLDQVDPARSRALLARLAPGHAAIQAVHFSANEVRILDARGNESPAGDATPRLLEVRAELQRHFSHARGFGPIEGLNYLDGVRIQFAGGDVAHVRPSGNAPQLRIYAVASTEERAEEIVAQGLAEPHGLLRSLLGG